MRTFFLQICCFFQMVVRGLNTPCTYAKAYASLHGLRGVPTRAQVSFQVPTRMPTRANVEFKCRSALWQLQLETRNFSVQLQFWQLRLYDQKCSTSENPMAARKGLRTQNALKAYTNAYARPTRSLREDCRTNKRKAKEANSFIVMICSTNAYAKSLREG